jgi:hypothetical protein
MCVTVNVIMPVAVTAVSNCRIIVRILVYIVKWVYTEKNLPRSFFEMQKQWVYGDFILISIVC